MAYDHDTREMQRLREEKARMEGQLAAHRQLLLRDPEFLDTLRAQAWLARDRSRVRLGEDGQSLLFPDEWPEGVDPSAYAERFLDRHQERAALTARLRELDDGDD